MIAHSKVREACQERKVGGWHLKIPRLVNFTECESTLINLITTFIIFLLLSPILCPYPYRSVYTVRSYSFLLIWKEWYFRVLIIPRSSWGQNGSWHKTQTFFCLYLTTHPRCVVIVHAFWVWSKNQLLEGVINFSCCQSHVTINDSFLNVLVLGGKSPFKISSSDHRLHFLGWSFKEFQAEKKTQCSSIQIPPPPSLPYHMLPTFTVIRFQKCCLGSKGLIPVSD